MHIMNKSGFEQRLSASAKDFNAGVKAALEARLGVQIFPIEDMQFSELITRLDHSGIDAFLYDKNGNPKALASRMNYQRAVAKKPAFSFRYARWNKEMRAWDCDREYIRKLYVGRHPGSFVLFPSLHVESFCKKRSSGQIGWSFAAETRDILEFAEQNLDNPDVVSIYEPRNDEPRKVISISIAEFAKTHPVIEVHATH